MKKDRYNKAKKIISLIDYHHKANLSIKTCLDIGCSSGEITEYLGNYFYKIVGIDIDKEAITDNKSQKSQSYVLGNSSHLPFEKHKFDYIICSQVYEHVESQSALVHEIKRLLKPEGICFFSGPNKYSIVEEHYWLPFLSWFPKFLSNYYMRLFKKGKIYDINPLSYKKLLDLLKDFTIHDYTLTLIKNPEKFFLSDYKIFHFLSKFPNFLLLKLKMFVPNFNLILELRDE